MKLLSAYEDGSLTIFLQGELDQHAMRQSAGELDALLERYLPRDCVLDLGGLSFMDSSGIALILKVHRLLTGSGGRVRVENAAAQPLRVLDAAGLDRLVSVGTGRGAGG